MARASFIVGLVFFVVTASCNGAPRVRTSFDARVDFARFSSFALLHPNHPVPSPGGIDPFTVFRLRQMAHATLAKQGYTPVAFERADLLVSVNAEARSDTEVIPASYWTPYRRDYYYGSDIRTYRTLLLTVDILEPSKKAVIWHGSTEVIADDLPDADLWMLVEAVLHKFPPQQEQRSP